MKSFLFGFIFGFIGGIFLYLIFIGIVLFFTHNFSLFNWVFTSILSGFGMGILIGLLSVFNKDKLEKL